MALAERPFSKADAPATPRTPTVVWLRGEHDIATAAALWETMESAAALDGGDLIVHMGGVSFMGAATIGVVVRTRNLLRSRSRTLVVGSPSPCARRVLDVCGLSLLVTGEPQPMATGAAPSTHRDPVDRRGP